MDIIVIYKNARCAVLEIKDGGKYNTAQPYDIYINEIQTESSSYPVKQNEFCKKTDTVITTVYNLKPDTEYVLSLIGCSDNAKTECSFRTDYEFVTLNVRDFGAKGDGEQDDTIYIQAAVMACPKNSRVLVPEGTYKITSLFLKDGLKLELQKGAVLSAYTDRSMFPIMPALVQSYDEEDEYNLGTWEGNPLPMFSAIITGINISDCCLYGEGTIDGNASFKNWWKDHRTMRTAFRPRMIFLNHCRNITVLGVTVTNSPSWNIHPYFSEELKFIDLKVINPKDSPNTDGLDPESCNRVEITGVYFSVGDDCIAIKSGKIYMGAKYKTPSQNIIIRQCCMCDGHGSVTIGSEMAGGVKKVTVRDCKFLFTDRGLRIKTRRGRGRQAVVDDIIFENIYMDNVMTPFVVNSFYFCDPDGHSEYVRTKEKLPVDERTPYIKTLVFKNIEAHNCHVAAAYLCGLPEQKIKSAEFNNVTVDYAKDALSGIAAMMDDADPMQRGGIYAENIENLILKDINIKGQVNDVLISKGIDNIVR